MKKTIIFIVISTLLMVLAGCNLYTVVPMEMEKEDGLIADQSDDEFDPDEYVCEIWSEVEEYTTVNAAKIEDVVSLFNIDKQKCIDDYCLVNIGEVDTARFLVYGKVKILSVVRESKIGIMAIDIYPYDGVSDALVQIGPVYKKNAVRDAMPFIIFEDFKNQLAFGDAGKAINKYIDTNIVLPSAIDAKIGSEIDFVGVFEDGESIIITPVSIKDV